MDTSQRALIVAAADAAPVTWRKSRRSGSSGDCVETASVRGEVAVRDSKHRDGPALGFTSATWEAFVAGLKSGQLSG